MELEPKTIQRSDFSTARRGYDPAEVDAHLREVAQAVNELQVRVEELSSRRPDSLSAAANERLQRILDAAEASAAEVRTEAGEEARQLIEEAQQEARTLTEEAERRARERETESETASADHRSRLDRRTGDLLHRADSLEEEFDRLLERMRAAATTSVETLRGDVQALRDELDDAPAETPASTSRSPEASDVGGRDRGLLAEPELRTAVFEPVAEEEPLGDEVIPEPHGGEALPDPPEQTRTEGRERSKPEPLEETPPEAREPSAPAPREGSSRGGRTGSARERTRSTRQRGTKSARERSGSTPERTSESTPARGTGSTREQREASSADALDERPRASSDDATAASATVSGEDPDTEGARLIALNMALSGSSRTETADYLRETFGLDDPALLDDVYERVQSS